MYFPPTIHVSSSSYSIWNQAINGREETEQKKRSGRSGGGRGGVCCGESPGSACGEGKSGVFPQVERLFWVSSRSWISTWFCGKILVFIYWFIFLSEDNTWEPEENLDCPDLIAEFLKSQKSAESGGKRRAESDGDGKETKKRKDEVRAMKIWGSEMSTSFHVCKLVRKCL